MKSNRLGYELLTASILPVSGILLAGVMALRQVASADKDISLLLLILLACALGVFFGEVSLLRFLEQERRVQIAELAATCTDYLTGNQQRRAVISDNEPLAKVASALNALLDRATVETRTAPSQETNQSNEPSKALSNLVIANDQPQQKDLQQIIDELTSILNGNLRICTTIPSGQIGVLADVLNNLVAQFTELVAWTYYSFGLMVETKRALLESSSQLTQTLEAHLQHLSATAGSIERLVTFMQQLKNTPLIDPELVREIHAQTQLQEEHTQTEEGQPPKRKRAKARATQLSADLLIRLNESIEQQSQVLEATSHTAEEHSIEAESLMAEMYETSQTLRHLCAPLFRSIESFNGLITLAAQWQDMLAGYQLPEEVIERFSPETDHTAKWLL
jgi:hypothetical protein